MSDDPTTAAAEALLEEARKSLLQFSGGIEPPIHVVANIALLSLNKAAKGDNVLFDAFMRSVVSSALGLGLPRKDVRRALLDTFDETWKAMSEELARSRPQ